MAEILEDAHRDLIGPDYTPVGHDFASITQQISSLVLRRHTHTGWLALFSLGNGLILMFGCVVIYLLVRGVGIWGINI
ncbi:MAG TPA: hypothetical protein VG433_08820, partial [Pirellulales bacterium]|nr:hypothetical protein [Pirellulales bacterium]